ncbi:NADH-quinone oxidoreductase subunit K [Myxococcus sp. SDU36]|uniref:NADH-quinone oxidoreductase subunit K n=1 Tax=Myxococcus sp. SDU36 TaxID=2831967 RepID=UPI0025434890|nr:NADH-quinone oxidoreductase subunit K [Myxococcus sp. SDU36]WIG98637.1 NADH-quinone oxidoreductase subunit K [Myxococcus sp. SDU36]
MSAVTLYLGAAAAVVAVALYGLLARAHLVRKLLSANLLGSGIFLVLVAVGRRVEPPDPVPSALVLTGIVVSVSTTGFALLLTRRLHEETGKAHLPEDDGPGGGGAAAG